MTTEISKAIYECFKPVRKISGVASTAVKIRFGEEFSRVIPQEAARLPWTELIYKAWRERGKEKEKSPLR